MATPKFYLDSHLSTEVAPQLRNKGVDIVHCSEVGMPDESDYDHLVYATAHLRIFVTCDAGIEWQLHYTWLAEGKPHGGIVYFRGEDQCKSMSVIINELLFLAETAAYEQDLYNQFWRASG